MSKKKFFKDVSYIAATKYSGIILSIIITALLARVLTPEDYGNVAIATVFIVFFTMLGDMGIAPAIVQFKKLSKIDIESIFGFSFWVALLLSIGFFFASNFISNYYSQPILSNICKILCGQIFFTVLNIVPNALLTREKKFKTIAIRNVSIQITVGVLAIYFAYQGIGVYALLIAPVLGAFLNLMVNVICMRLGIKLIPKIAPLKVILNFSLYQFLFGFVNYFNRNMDKFIIGKFVNIQQLGYYEKSYRLMMMPIQNINGVITPVLHSYLTDSVGNIEKIKDLFIRMTRILINIACILAVYLFVTSREIVLIVYGSQWIPAVVCFKILSISTISQITSVTIGSYMQVCNKTKVLFFLGLVNTLIFLSLLAITVAIFRTTESICISFVIAFLLEAMTSFYALTKYCFKDSLICYLKPMAKPICFFLISVVVFSFVNRVIETLSLLCAFFVKTSLWVCFSYTYLTLCTKYKPIQIIKSILNKTRK